MDAYTGVISVSQRLDKDRLRNGTRINQRRSFRWRANSRISPTYEVTSLPPIWTVTLSGSGTRIAAMRYSMTSSMPMGCEAVLTQRGVIITGSRSTRARISSKDALPEPIITEAWNSSAGIAPERRILPVSNRLRI